MSTTLKQLQAQIHQVMRGEISVGEGAERLGVDPARLSIYEGFVRGHIDGVLDKHYGRVKAYLCADLWADLKAGFYAAQPARSWELNAAVEAFPTYLASRAAAGEAAITPYLISLARFEWTEFEIYVHPARISAAEGALNPTLTILELPCPVIEAVVGWDEAALPAQTTEAEGPERILFFRDPQDMGVCFQRAVDDLLFAVKVAHEGLDPDEVARALGLDVELARAATRRAIELGLVLEERVTSTA